MRSSKQAESGGSQGRDRATCSRNDQQPCVTEAWWGLQEQLPIMAVTPHHVSHLCPVIYTPDPLSTHSGKKQEKQCMRQEGSKQGNPTTLI